MTAIRKTGEVTAVQMLVEDSSRDAFVGTVAQSGILPHTFPYGISHVLKFAYSKQILAGRPLSRQGFYENQELLDAVGQLFGQHLHHRTDGNGFESYLYLGAPDNAGALRNMAYSSLPALLGAIPAAAVQRLAERQPAAIRVR
jgi:hypothetical protein